LKYVLKVDFLFLGLALKDCNLLKIFNFQEVAAVR